MRRALLSLVVLTLAGCGGSSQSSGGPQAGGGGQSGSGGSSSSTGSGAAQEVDQAQSLPPWARGEPPAAYPDTTFAFAVGAGPDLAQAQAAATTALVEKLWGPLRSERPSVDGHPLIIGLPPATELTVNLESFAEPSGRHSVLLSVARDAFTSFVKARLAEPARFGMIEGMAPIAQVRRAVAKLEHATFHHAVCARHPELATCPAPALEPLEKALASLAPRVTVSLTHAGGIGYRPGEAARRSVSAAAAWETELGYDQAFVDLPLVARQAGVVFEQGQTDAKGRYKSGTSLQPAAPGSFSVAVNRQALLGRFEALWPEVEASAPLRQLTALTARVHLGFTEKVSGAPTRFATDAMARSLKERRVAVADLAPELKARLAKERAADASAGDIDVLVIGEVESHFASRMGARSVWHNATASLTLIDAWDGTELGRASDSTQAVGIGDDDAAARALEQLGGRLAEKIAIVLMQTWGAPLSTSRAP